ncbi:hypothetical protein AQB9606_04097 [Aquabacterium sp. CECT 9606]|nr:hypothetical protein AQB9606_04097 [Aquabacterium sp. CECT 9606]
MRLTFCIRVFKMFSMDGYFALPFVLPYAFAFWGVLIWAYYIEGVQHKRSQQRMAKHDGADKYSGLVIAIGSTVLQFAAFGLTFYAPWRISEPQIYIYFWAGLALVVTGMLLRKHCWRVLGEFFTPTVTIAKEHKVVDKGAYKWVRHPSYSGAIMTAVGVGLALGNYGSIAVMVIGHIAIYIYRIEAEETALERALGEAYAKFKSNRRRLIPFVY